MKKWIRAVSFFAVLLIPCVLYGQGIIISGIRGVVEFRPTQTALWQPAAIGNQVPQQGSIRTGPRSRAALIFPNGSKVWLQADTTIEVRQHAHLINDIALERGSVKTRVPRLRRKEVFQFRTPTAVAAVRGTVFVIKVDEYGGTSLQVLFGEIKFDRVAKDTTQVLESFVVTQGMGFSEGEIVILTPQQEMEGLENWTPDVPDEKRQEQLIRTSNERQQIRHFSHAVKNMEREVREVREQVKEQDFAAGRTLVDVHGNVVRVDQRLDRPDSSTVQLVNVVKRQGYTSGGFKQYSYNGPTGARIDAMIAKVKFNKELPANINEFPGFFKDEGENIKLDQASLILANIDSATNETFTIAFLGSRDKTSTSDEIDPDLYIGTFTDSAKRSTLFALDVDNATTNLTRFKEDSSVKSVDSGDSDTGELSAHYADRWKEVGNESNTVWLASEQFIINNSGGIRNVSDFTSGGTDYETLLKESAGEIGAFVKQDVSGAPSRTLDVTANRNSGTTGFKGGNVSKRNVDLVFTPDLALAIIKSLASSAEDIQGDID